MRHKVFGAIGVLLGGGALLRWMLSGTQISGSGPYQAGQMVGLVVAVLLLLAGAYSLLRKPA